MGDSIFVKITLLVIAVILAVGFYLTLDAVSYVKVASESLTTEVRALRSDVARLNAAGGVAAASPRPSAESPQRPRFANEDLRDPDAVDGDAIVLSTTSETANMNLLVNNESQVGDFWGMTYDAPAERSYRNPDRFEPKLAESWEISPDKKSFTIHLRKGVLWHDFTDPVTRKRFEDVEVTAEDFKFFLDVIRHPKVPCEPLRVYYQDLETLKVLDRYTFQVVWKEPYFLAEEMTLGLYPLPRHFYAFDPDDPDKSFTENTERNRMIVGCGPWVFDRWEKGREILFRRNEKYYAPKPHFKRITLKVIKEPTAQLQALRNGELDRIGLLPEQWAKQTDDEAFRNRFAKFQYAARVYSYVGYNLRRDLFKDRRVRLALTHLTDRDRILKDVYLGLGRITTGPFYMESSSYDASIQPHPYDPERARALLAEAGWKDSDGDGVLDKDGKKFEFTFLAIASSKIQQRIAEILREDFAKAGIVVQINPIEWSVYTQRLDEWNFDVCSLGWAMGWDQDPYQIWHSSQADLPKSSNHVGFKNAEADQLIEAARREFDPVKRNAMYHAFHRILHEEQPYTFLITPYSLVAQDKRFRNAKVYPLGMHLDSFWTPVAEQKHKD